MTGENRSTVDEMIPPDVHEALARNPDSLLVDVRTRAEWTFTGTPDLTGLDSGLGKRFLPVEWQSFPDMARNERFYDELIEQAGGSLPEQVFFICRSGGRSMAAARHVAEMSDAAGQAIRCTNVAEGFEGDLDENGHRGQVNGWKVHGLPWRQG